MILGSFDLQVTLTLRTKFQHKCLFSSGEEANNRFWSRRLRRPSWISDRNNFSFFLSTCHPNASYKFQVNWPFRSGEKAKNRFSDRNDFSWVFLSTSHSDASYQESIQLASYFRRRSNGGYLGFSIGKCLAIFIYKSPWCSLPSNRSIGRSIQEKNWKIDFQDGRQGGHLGFLIEMILVILDLQKR